jgi:type IV secretory pathway VirB4 component
VLSLRELRGQVGERRMKALSFVARDWVWKRVRFGPARPRIVVVDEAWLLLKHDPAAAMLLEDLARSTRKQKCGLITVTQNVADIAGTSLGEAILENAGCAVLLGQHAHAVDAVGDAFDLSEGERDHIRTCPKGHGLFISGPERAALEVIASSDEHALAAVGPNAPGEFQAAERRS